MNNTYTIDATGKKLGRLASEVASILLGKKNPDFEKHLVANVKVTVTNASKMDITERKAQSQMYRRYTGSRGGLREESLGEMAAKKGYGSVLEKAISGMLHNNKLKSKMLLNLTISE
ncbi:MAG: 50S ribosomal protein L13 [bacterium]